MKLKPSEIIRMDTNTSPFLPKSVVAISKKLTRIPVNEYPDTSYFELRNAFSSYCGMSADNFVVTNGADEALDIISKTVVEPNDEVMIPTPTYSMFRIVSEIMGAKVVAIRRKPDFKLDIEEIRKRKTGRTKIIFLCSPNNPTGNSVSHEEMKSIIESCGEDVAVVVDEAYFEFSGHTISDLALTHDNVLVVRTLSKAFSMAGARVGYIIAHKNSVGNLNIVRPPNSLSVISLDLAIDALRNTSSMRTNVRTIVKEREKCIRIMHKNKGLEVFPSEANFILFRVRGGGSEKLHKNLMKKGFVLRNFSKTAGVENCLRVTINKPEINRSFLDQLQILTET